MTHKESDLSIQKAKVTPINSHKLARDAVDLAYKLDSKSKYSEASSKLQNTKLIDTGWDILCTSSDNLATSQYGYKAVAFVNRDTKEIHIATAGTKPKEKYDITDDLRITFGYTPSKMAALKSLIDNILSSSNDFEKYVFSTSGHSLGGVLSDLTAVEILSRGLSFETSTTFDTPGSKKVIENAVRDQLFTGKVTKDIMDKLPDHCIEYNARPNFINTINEHYASTIYLVTPSVTPIVSQQVEAASDQSGIWGFGQYLYNKVGTTVSQCSEYLGIHSITSQLESHKLLHFQCIYDEVAPITKVENWGNKVSEQLVLKPEELAKLAKVTPTGNDVIVITDTLVEEEDYLSLDYKEFGYNDLSRCNLDPVMIGDTEDYELLY